MKCVLPMLVGSMVLAQGAVDTLTAHLAQTSRVHADFTQTRHLAALTRPLVSSGSFVMDQHQGVLWQMRKPMALTFVMGPQGIYEVGADGKRKAAGAREAPMVAQMGRIVRSLLKGQWKALEDFFVLRGEGSPAKWEVWLDPRPATAAYLKRVRIQGAQTLERITVEEAAGDRTELAFQKIRIGQPLSDAEARLFAVL